MTFPARILLLVCLPLAAQAAAGPSKTILVVVNSQVPETSISSDNLAAIYLRRMVVWPNGQPIVAVNQPLRSRERQRFSQFAFGRPPSALADYWSRKHFQGVNPPLVMPSDAAVVKFVRKIPGAIGYIHLGQPMDGIKVIRRLSGEQK